MDSPVIKSFFTFLTSFLKEHDGKSSMTRLAMLFLTISACAVAGSWVYVTATKPGSLTAHETAGFSAVISALVLNGVVALKERSKKNVGNCEPGSRGTETRPE